MGEGDVVIHLRDVWVVATRTEQKVDLIALAVTDMRDRSLPDHEARIRAVEKRVWAIPSAAALVAVASLVISLLTFQGRATSPARQSTRTPSITAPAPVRAATAVSRIATAKPVPTAPKRRP